MNITVVGMGYVGLANAFVLAKKNNVIIYDIDKTKIINFNKGVLPLHEDIFDDFFSNESLQLKATHDKKIAYKNADIIYLALPTNFNSTKNSFETSVIDIVVEDILNVNRQALIVIKSTIPIGYTEHLKQITNYDNIIFCPEFLREDKALTDCLSPSRIVIGGSKRLKNFEKILQESCVCDKNNIIYTSNSEAEAIKLFSNAYLAMRISFFNELDTFAYQHNLNTTSIISGICKDPRIGNYYNNPSFGFGGYCLPKDTKQIISQTKNNNILLSAIVKSNENRKNFIAEIINNLHVETVGIYRLNMKKNSNNFRNSAVLDIMKNIKAKIVIYEPLLKKTIGTYKLENNLNIFKNCCDVIVANRMSNELLDVKNKVITRDVYGTN